MRENILLIEDEEALRTTLSDRLRGEGYVVDAAGDGEEGLDKATTLPFDLIILDIMLPYRSGFDVCRDIRQAGLATPVLFLTVRDQTVDKVVGLKLGADDYVTKPFSIRELMARVKAVLRRVSAPLPPLETYKFSDVEVNIRSNEVRRDGEIVDLSAKEFALLAYFIAHPVETLSRDRLLDAVWGYENYPTTRTVDTHIVHLRQKLEPNPEEPRFILTVHGSGYKFVG
jgi:DNA-binding response OmpR family regulator